MKLHLQVLCALLLLLACGRTAPGLKRGWWNEINEPETETLRDRYSKLYEALLALQKVRFAGCRAAVAELRDFWRSLPQLDEVGSNQITEACGTIISELK